MLKLNRSSDIMMAILWSPESSHDETQQYLIIFGSKVALNTLVLFFWMRSIHRSLLGICSISVHVVDMLLVSAVAYVWCYKEPTSTSMCFILAHGSSVYAFLPLPVIIAGALDYTTYPNIGAGRRSQRRTVIYCITVLLMWASACAYSYRYTDTQPIEIYKGKDVKVLACHDHGSTVVFHFSVELSVMVGVILLLYWRKLIGWIRRANGMAQQRNCEKHQDFAYSRLRDSGDAPPLFVSLTLGFSMSWMPYLVICVSCDLLGLVVPAYVSVNLLWMACVNSALAGISLWYQSDRTGAFHKFPDDICLWNIYWHLSRRPASVNTVHLSEPLDVKTSVPFQKI